MVSRNPDHFLYVDRQLDMITHRGPDEEGKWRGDGVFLGSRRLSIIDLKGGNQPIFNEDSTLCIVYNGELYNFLDLRPELISLGHVFRTRSDTEVILHAFEEWGDECLRRFNGMFAFAIWDTERRRLFIARDRVGEKPLYYFSDPHRFVFASEIKSIVADPSVARQVNPRGIANFFTYGHGIGPDTMFNHIFKLLPGHFLSLENGKVHTVQYWDVGDETTGEMRSNVREDDYIRQIRDLLDDAVRRRMIADVPVGAFLSGGVDSTAVVALMRSHATGPVKTFSLGFKIGGAYNELSDARRAATYLGTEHHELEVDHVDMIGTLEKLVYSYDEPFGDAANFPLYLLSAFARKHVTVVLAGEGGDELFGGYRRYVADGLAPWYQHLPAFVSAVLPQLAGSIPRLRRIKRILRTLPIKDPALRYSAWLEVFNQEMLHNLLVPSIINELGSYDPRWQYSRYYYRNLSGGTVPDHLNRIMYVDFKTWLPDTFMEKVDKATMACSLE
ncbi:MAG: asparagine synthase (glutamine-hydrolyzing), partial [Bacteroidota bacterium]